MASDMTIVLKIVDRSRRMMIRFSRDNRGLAAVEFAFIVPLMLVLLFGMIDTSSGVAVDRKVTLTARSLSDLVSQGTNVSQNDLKNFFGLGGAIMAPYSVTAATMTQKVTQLAVDGSKNVKVAWSYSATVNNNTATITQGYDKNAVITTVPANLLVPNTYLIWSEVSYKYTPITGYLIGTVAIPLSDETYTRPRQSDCVYYGTSTTCTP